MNELAHLASLLDLTEDEVNDLTNAILAVEGRPLSAVQADIRTVMNLTGTQMRNTCGRSAASRPRWTR